MKSLENGIEIELNDNSNEKVFGTIICVTGNALALCDICGYLSPSANHFCMNCMIHRANLQNNISGMFEKRSVEQHRRHI